MPYYDNSLYGPSEEPSEALQSPTRDDHPSESGGREGEGAGGAGRIMPPDDTQDAERPMRRRREILSPVPSPIPNSPAYHSYREDVEGEAGRELYGGSEGRGGVGAFRLHRHSEDVDETEQQQQPPSKSRAFSALNPPAPLSYIPAAGASSKHRPVEEFLSLPRAKSSPQIPGAGSTVRAMRYASRAGNDAAVAASGGAAPHADSPERRRGDAGGLVSSRPRPAMHGAIEPLSRAAPAPYYMHEKGAGSGDIAVWGAGGDVSTMATTPQPRRPRRRTPPHSKQHRQHAADHDDDDDDGSLPPQAPPAQCPRCDYRLPVEMQSYLQETSTRRSVVVPPLHCPECGSRLVPAVATSGASERLRGTHASARGAPQGERDDAEPPSSRRQQQLRRRERRRERRAEDSSGDGDDNADDDRGRRQEQQPEPRSSRRSTTTASAPQPPPRLPEPDSAASPSPPLSTCLNTPGSGDAAATHASQQPGILIPKYPYLTPDLLSRSLDAAIGATSTSGAVDGPLSASSSGAEDIAVPWAVHSCLACNRQCGTCLAGILCCFAMPCLLARERQLLLFHRLRSRYICCAGAFPCCVPPRALRPELYHMVGPDYLYGASEAEWQRYGDDADAALERAERSGGAYDHRAAPQRPLANLRSSRGVASPSSLVNPQTGLPLEGCYSNSTAHVHHHDPVGEASGTPSTPPPQRIGTGCCDCVVCIDDTCVCDCTRGCCVYCIHPTACCLACPLCCLCCEMTLCTPCALWANRLLIRQHYHLTPDSVVDSGAMCCYACCVTCCMCSCDAAPRSPPTSLSCWGQLAASVAACLGAVCCQCPCASCALAQQRDQIQRLGYPLVVEIPPEMEML